MGDEKVDSINEELAGEGLGELTFLPTAAFRRNMSSQDFETLSENVQMVNPAPIPSFLGDKAEQNWTFWDGPGTVPGYQPLDFYAQTYSDMEKAIEEVQDDIIDDVPLVIKPRSSSCGNGIYFYPGGVDEMVEDWREEGIPQGYLAQYAIPHEFDLRTIAAKDTPVNGMRRYGNPDTDRANLSLLDSKSTEGKAKKALEQGAAEGVDIDELDPAVQNMVEDHVEAFAEEYEKDLDELETWVGWDFLAVDPYDRDLQEYPDEIVEPLLHEDYQTEDGNYLIFCEGNLSPGSIIDYINQEPEQDTAANLWNYVDSVSRGEEFERGVPDVMDIETLQDRYRSL
ncbi:MAG: hypothetical protein ABEJ87_05925 [Candidatus Nanohalobium sp.]